MRNMSAVAVGKEIVCYCTRCRMDLGHTVTAVAASQIARVICRTCRSEHNYKGKKGVSTPLKAGEAPPPSTGTHRRMVDVTTPKAPKPQAVPVELEWSRQMNASASAIKPYAPAQTFKIGDKLSHPTFGMGIVQKTVYPNKVEILFQGDIKTLIHKP